MGDQKKREAGVYICGKVVSTSITKKGAHMSAVLVVDEVFKIISDTIMAVDFEYFAIVRPFKTNDGIMFFESKRLV